MAGPAGYLLQATPPARVLAGHQDEVHQGGSRDDTPDSRRWCAFFFDARVASAGLKLKAPGKTSSSTISERFSLQEIVEIWGLSTGTLHIYIRNIYEKLQCPFRHRSDGEVSQPLSRT